MIPVVEQGGVVMAYIGEGDPFASEPTGGTTT